MCLVFVIRYDLYVLYGKLVHPHSAAVFVEFTVLPYEDGAISKKQSNAYTNQGINNIVLLNKKIDQYWVKVSKEALQFSDFTDVIVSLFSLQVITTL